MNSETKQKKSPRISVNSLGEYLDASAIKRGSIIKDQKVPATFRTSYYNDAISTITKYLVAGTNDSDILVQKIEFLDSLNPDNDWHETKIRNNILCLQSFYANHSDSLDISRFNLVQPSKKVPKLSLSGVAISVRPEVYLIDKEHPKRCGALKLYIKKGEPIEKGRALNSTILVHRWVKKYLASDAQSPCSMSMIYDIFGDRVFCAPKHQSRRFENIQASCLEIRQRWDSI